jgi:tRNA threonylcarbamoyladenosine biosynthesis protein TsaE
MTAAPPTRAVLDLALPDLAATAALAGRLAVLARPGDVFALSGDLGTGKTAFARSFIEARSGGAEEVPSPTFTLVQTYDLPGGAVWHFDLYRLAHPEEALELAIEDAFAEGIALVEWPDRLGALLPRDRLDLAFAMGDDPDARRVRVTGFGSWAARLDALARDG